MGLLIVQSYLSGESVKIWFEQQQDVADVEAVLQRTKGAGIDAENFLGQTGLMYAINQGNFALVRLLVSYGADVNAKSSPAKREQTISWDNTPLHYAALQINNRKTLPIIDLLVDGGADINAQNTLGETPLDWSLQIAQYDLRMDATKTFIADLSDVNIQNNMGNTYLHLAVINFDIEWVQQLMQTFGSMFDLSLKSNEGMTAEQLANYLTRTYIRDSIIQAEKNPVGMGDKVKQRDVLGRTGLMLAIIRNSLPFAERQIDKGADVQAIDTTRFANTSLHFAVIRKFNITPFVQLLLSKDANPNAANAYGDTPLPYLIRHNINAQQRDAVAKMLIDAGANPTVPNARGKSAIRLAQKKDAGFAAKLEQWYKQKKK